MFTTRNALLGLGILAALVMVLQGASARDAGARSPTAVALCSNGERYIVYGSGLGFHLRLWTADTETRVELPEVDARGVCGRVSALSASGLRFEPDPLMEALPILPQDAAPARAPDPRYQWHLTQVQAPRAWDVGMGEGGVVAVIDTGTDCSHPGLKDRCMPGTDYVGGRPQGPGLPGDGHGHGTHVAGLAADALDGYEGSGVAPLARIRPMRVLGDSGWGDTATIARAILDAAQPGAVLNLSLGGPEGSTALKDAVAVAASRGAHLVIARGNGGGTAPSYPVCYEPSIGVAATDPEDGRADFSDYGQGACTDVAAPGYLLMSTWPGGGYRALSGTSMASPVTAGVLALLVGLGDRDPVGTLVRTQARVIDPTIPGRVDALAAVSAVAPGPTVTPAPTATAGPTWTPRPTLDPYPGRTATAAATRATPTQPPTAATRTATRPPPSPTAAPVRCEDLGLCEGGGGLFGMRRVCGPCR